MSNEVMTDREALNEVDKINYKLVKNQSLSHLNHLNEVVSKTKVFGNQEIELAEIVLESIHRMNSLPKHFKSVKVVSLETLTSPKAVLKMRIKDTMSKLYKR